MALHKTAVILLVSAALAAVAFAAEVPVVSAEQPATRNEVQPKDAQEDLKPANSIGYGFYGYPYNYYGYPYGPWSSYDYGYGYGIGYPRVYYGGYTPYPLWY